MRYLTAHDRWTSGERPVVTNACRAGAATRRRAESDALLVRDREGQIRCLLIAHNRPVPCPRCGSAIHTLIRRHDDDGRWLLECSRCGVRLIARRVLTDRHAADLTLSGPTAHGLTR